jgi:peptidoglycan/LPS O-acetylase OafA/YrhL
MTRDRDSNETAISHIRGLDGLRGIAISLVVIHHFGSFAFADKEWFAGQLIERAVYLGWAGVDLFFVLSGFLITSILFSSRANSRYFSIFYSRRALRIFPIYFAVLIVSLILLPQWSTEIAQKLLGESLGHQL